jgi:hypothetical protein
MENVEFEVGMVFSYVKELRDALKACIIREGVKLEKIRNKATRIDVACRGE